MKRLIFILVLMIFIPVLAYADFLPHNAKSIKHYGIGVLNKPEDFKVYSEPDLNSTVLREIKPLNTTNSSIVSTNRMKYNLKETFIAIRSKANIALLTVETVQDNGWYEVYINQRKGETGWVYEKNSKNFYTWQRLFLTFGKTHGLRFMHGVTDDIQTLHSKDSTDSQVIKMLEYPSKINFSMIKGNWMLVTAHEFDSSACIGWLRWRNDDGSLNLFPMF